MKYLFRASSFLLFIGLATDASAQTMLYISKFDPISATAIESMKRALNQGKAKRIVIVPLVDSDSKEPLATRIRLIEASIGQDARIQVGEALAKEGGALVAEKDVAPYFAPYPENERQMLVLGQDNIESMKKLVNHPDLLTTFVGDEDEIKDLEDRSAYKPEYNLKTKSPVGIAESFQSDPLINEQHLTREAAEIVRKEKLYGHTGERGYYGLPEQDSDWLDQEQKVNDKIQNQEVFSNIRENTLAKEYLPESRAVFRIHYVDLPSNLVKVWKLDDYKFPYAAKGKDKVRLFIHPASLNAFREKLPKKYQQQIKVDRYLATPTASYRSLAIWDSKSKGPLVGVKTSLEEAKIGGVVRRVSSQQMQRSVGIAALMASDEFTYKNSQDPRFILEPEGVALDATDSGHSVRAFQQLEKGDKLYPFFSLYSRRPDYSPPILVDWIKESGRDPQEFLSQEIISPLVREYVRLAMEEGFLGQPHEQNTTMIRKADGTLVRNYRDLSGFDMDQMLRDRAKKTTKDIPKNVDISLMKPDEPGILIFAQEYLMNSNFYALHKSMKPFFSKVNKSWVEKEYKAQVVESMKAYIPDASDDFRVLARQIRQYRGFKTCPDLFAPID